MTTPASERTAAQRERMQGSLLWVIVLVMGASLFTGVISDAARWIAEVVK